MDNLLVDYRRNIKIVGTYQILQERAHVVSLINTSYEHVYSL